MMDDLTNFSSPKHYYADEAPFIVQPAAFFKEIGSSQSQPKSVFTSRGNLSQPSSKVSRRKEKNEKNFKDLNKSLANLASKRLTGRSSSNNDAINYVETEIYSSGSQLADFEFKMFDFDPTAVSKTPISYSKQSGKLCQTTVQKNFEMTPEHFYENRKAMAYNPIDKHTGELKEITLHDLNYSKFQKRKSASPAVGYPQRLVPSQQVHTEGSISTQIRPSNKIQDFSRYMNKSSLSNFKPASNLHVDIRPHSQEMTEQKPNPKVYTPALGKHHIYSVSATNVLVSDPRRLDRKDSRASGYTKESARKVIEGEVPVSDTPSFKNLPKTHFIYDMHERIERHTKRRLDQLLKPGIISKSNWIGGGAVNTSVANSNNNSNNNMVLNASRSNKTHHYFRANTSEGDEGPSDMESFEHLDKNQVSDGVEYMEGGVGINHVTGMDTEECETTAKEKEMNAVNALKQDLLKIKKDIELRKSSYEDVNKFMRMYKQDSRPGSRTESKDLCTSAMVTEATRRCSQETYTRQTGASSRQSLEAQQGLRTCGGGPSSIYDRQENNSNVRNYVPMRVYPPVEEHVSFCNINTSSNTVQKDTVRRGKEPQRSVSTLFPNNKISHAAYSKGFKATKSGSDFVNVKMMR